MKKQIEVRMSGFGGQGIMTAGQILGKAAAVHEGRNAVMAQSYGPESRGGASSAEILISDGEIPYPHVSDPDAVLILAQEAYAKYGKTRPDHTLMVVEADLVELDPVAEKGKRCVRVPVTKLAEKVGKRLVTNMVALGALAKATQIVSADSLRKAIAEFVPPGTEELNLKAFEAGYAAVEAAP